MPKGSGPTVLTMSPAPSVLVADVPRYRPYAGYVRYVGTCYRLLVIKSEPSPNLHVHGEVTRLAKKDDNSVLTRLCGGGALESQTA